MSKTTPNRADLVLFRNEGNRTCKQHGCGQVHRYITRECKPIAIRHDDARGATILSGFGQRVWLATTKVRAFTYVDYEQEAAA